MNVSSTSKKPPRILSTFLRLFFLASVRSVLSAVPATLFHYDVSTKLRSGGEREERSIVQL